MKWTRIEFANGSVHRLFAMSIYLGDRARIIPFHNFWTLDHGKSVREIFFWQIFSFPRRIEEEK